jgi:hydroxymethylbilane synthase
VHSYKDLPTQTRPELVIVAVPKREHPEDVLVCRHACSSIDALKAGAVAGTSSPRRSTQIKRLRPDVEVRPIRGNVETRLRKVRDGEYDATVLARAGLVRLRMTDSIGFVFDPREFIPAPAQGALAIQTRADDVETVELVRGINDNVTEQTVAAERRVLELLHPGCHAPVGVYAKIEEDEMRIIAFAAGPDGIPFLREEVCGPATDSTAAAERLAAMLIEKGAKEIIEQYE